MLELFTRGRRRPVFAGLLALAGTATLAGWTGHVTSGYGAPRVAAANHASDLSVAALELSGHSYGMVTSLGAVLGFGASFHTSPPPVSSPVVGMAAAPNGRGAWVAEANGGVHALGSAGFFGSMGNVRLNRPVVGMAATTDGGGYWLVASDGGVFSFGDARFYGSTGALRLNRPVVGIAATPDARGYWLVASDGGVFSFGDARFHGSTGAVRLNRPVLGMAATADGGGYWLVASDGGIFSFGDARFHGSTGNVRLNRPVVGMAATPDDGGYWLAAGDGGVFTFGDAPFYGSASGLGLTAVGIATEAGGYRNPLRAIIGLIPERVDQGVDYAGSGPIYAVGDGVVLNTTNPGWPGGAFISYELVDGPARGEIVYTAENVVPEVSIGQEVTSLTVLGTLIGAYPNLEIGWAAYPGDGESEARAAGQWTVQDGDNSIPTAFGENFSRLLVALGAPPGISYAKPVGSLPRGWPIW
jgi:hypothetical protein